MKSTGETGEAETGDLMTKMKGVGIISRDHISIRYIYRNVYSINTCTNKKEQCIYTCHIIYGNHMYI